MNIDPEGYEPDEFDAELAVTSPAIRADMRLDTQVAKALVGLSREPKLYYQPGRLVFDTGDQLTEIGRGSLAVMVERRCDVVRETKSGPVRVRPDAHLLDALLNMPAAPSQLRRVDVVAPYPAVTADARMLPPGYDPKSKTLARAVTVRRGGDLKALLADLLADYDEAARATWLAAVAGQLGRAHYPIQPGWIITANQPRAGKTMLAQLATRVLAGVDPVILTLSQDPNEVAKGLASAVELRPIVVFDNVTHMMGSDALESYISSEYWNYRVLGGSGVSTIRSNSMIVFTANGAQARRDIADRSMVTQLIRPPGPGRWVHRDPLARADALRADILGAILDALERRAGAGWPEPAWEDGGRHVGWNRWGRGLAWDVYGIDVLAFRGNVDSETDDLTVMLEALQELYGDGSFQAGEVLIGDWNDAKERVRGSIANLLRTPVAKVDSRSVGTVLTKFEMRWGGNLAVSRTRIGPSRKAGWRVVIA